MQSVTTQKRSQEDFVCNDTETVDSDIPMICTDLYVFLSIWILIKTASKP